MTVERKKRNRGPRSSKRRPRRGKGKPAQAAVPVVKRSSIDTALPADEPLTAEEQREMKRHLAFIRKHRTLLRPRLNAKEALLVEGAREPEHRGTCLYLLSKIDLRTIRAALEREPVKSNASARARFLAEAAGMTGDLGVLLSFLESLCSAASSRDAARAFTRAVGRIDFGSISAARLSRLLDVMLRAFPEHELPGALFGLLQNAGFRKAFDEHAAELTPDVAARFVALRVVWDALPGGRRKRGRGGGASPDPRVLGEGLELMLSAPPSMLEAWPRSVRQRLLACSLELEQDWILGHPGVLSLLRSLPADSPAKAQQGLLYARNLVRHGRFAAAAAALRDLGAASDGDEVGSLLQAIEAPRVGPLALPAAPEELSGLVRAFHLGWLRPVLARLGGVGGQAAMKAESQVQAGLCLPGVATVLGSGLAEEGHPWAVLSCMGRPLDQALADRQTRLSHRDAVALALAGVRILRALALVGVALPDAHPGRFVVSEGLYWDGLVLADLSGATAPGEGEAGARCHALAVEWCRDALLFPPFRGRALRRELPTHTKAALVKALAEGEPPWVLAKVLVGAG